MTGKASYKDKTEVAGESLLVVNSSSFVNKIKHGTAKPGGCAVKTNPLLHLSSAQVNTDARFLQQAFGKSIFIKIIYFLAF